jgi:hypothetical protein
MFKNIAAGVCVTLLAVVCAGCGKTGPARYEISGNVSYNGMPLPAGTISFDPVGQEMGGGFASIENGQYDTEKGGRGHLGGKHLVTIVGTDGKRLNPNDPDSGMKSLFQPYETEVDLPTSKGTQDFEVPE